MLFLQTKGSKNRCPIRNYRLGSFDDSEEIAFCKILNSSCVCRNLLLHHFKIPPRPIGKEFAGPYILLVDFRFS